MSTSSSRATEHRLGTKLCENGRKWERIGRLQATDLAPFYEFLAPRMTEVLGFGEGEVRAFVRESRERLRAEDGLQWVMYVTVGKAGEAALVWVGIDVGQSVALLLSCDSLLPAPLIFGREKIHAPQVVPSLHLRTVTPHVSGTAMKTGISSPSRSPSRIPSPLPSLLSSIYTTDPGPEPCLVLHSPHSNHANRMQCTGM